MMKTNRFWFLRFAEGTEGAQAGGSGNSSDGGDGENQSSQVDWEAKVKELEAERDKWKGFARTWEDRAKANESAVEKLNELESAGESDVDQLREQLEKLQAERDAERAELAKVKRAELVTRIAAAEGVREEDLEFLPDTDDEEVLRKHAKRLAVPGGAEDPNQGRGQSAGSSREAIIERAKNL